MVPELKPVKHFDEINHNNYYLFSSNGYPTILNDIKNAASDINNCGHYSHLVVCLDADDVTSGERKQEIEELFRADSLSLQAELVIIVQNCCFETWFLGNRKVYPRNPQDEILKNYCRFYNVSSEDPEKMPNFPGFNRTAQLHENYLKLMLKEKRIRYTKQNPGNVGEPHYIEALKNRLKDTPNHLNTLGTFFNFCQSIKTNIPTTTRPSGQ